MPRLSGWIGERRVSAKLKRLFPAVRHDLILPDGRGGLTQLDHLALTPAGLLVVETKTYSGIILGQANESTWTQVIGRRRHSFHNPLRQNYAHVRALEALVPDIPIEGQVVFAGSARFPKGLPEGVCRPSELADELRVPAPGRGLGGSFESVGEGPGGFPHGPRGAPGAFTWIAGPSWRREKPPPPGATAFCIAPLARRAGAPQSSGDSVAVVESSGRDPPERIRGGPGEPAARYNAASPTPGDGSLGASPSEACPAARPIRSSQLG